jgi:hypothetical protein
MRVNGSSIEHAPQAVMHDPKAQTWDVYIFGIVANLV